MLHWFIEHFIASNATVFIHYFPFYLLLCSVLFISSQQCNKKKSVVINSKESAKKQESKNKPLEKPPAKSSDQIGKQASLRDHVKEKSPNKKNSNSKGKPKNVKTDSGEKASKLINSKDPTKKVEANKNEEATDEEKKEKTVIEKVFGNMFKRKKEDKTQIEEPSEHKEGDIINMEKVERLGNIDVLVKEKKAQQEKEIEEMKSTHEMDEPSDGKMNPGAHVVIDEKKCKLYETNDEPTLDEEGDENAL